MSAAKHFITVTVLHATENVRFPKPDLIRKLAKYSEMHHTKSHVSAIYSHLPGTGPQTRGIISNMAEHDGSSKHSWRAKIQLNIAIAGFPCVPMTF